MLLLGWAVAGVLHAAVDAPVTDVTVYSDQARVVRTATLDVSGTQRVELPRLPDLVDPDSIRVEAEGAQVSSVEVRQGRVPPFPEKEARALVETLDRLDGDIELAEAERAAIALQVTALRRIRPSAPTQAEPSSGPMSPGGWSTSTAFLIDTAAKLETRGRELEERAASLKDERARRSADAARLVVKPQETGLEVAASLTGAGAATVRLSYLVPQNARWYPRYELQLHPETQRVQVAFSGRVSQETGEDWTRARLTLSTAQPSTLTQLPKLPTWKLGVAERFIPRPQRKAGQARPLLPVLTPAPEPDFEQVLRQWLQARAASMPLKPAATSGTLVGTVIDSQARSPVADVVVSAHSPSLPGEQLVVTDAQGRYRIPALPPGEYTLRFEKEQYKPYARTGVTLRPYKTVKLDVEFLPESLGEVVEIAKMPLEIDEEFVRRVAVERGKSGARSFESLAEVAPAGSSQSAAMGVSLAGATSDLSVPVFDRYVGLAPPKGWVAPVLAEDLPVSLAGGYDLAFSAPRPESVFSGQGERTIPLRVESWPVELERQAFPALAPEAYLVAHLKGSSRGALPGGQATLFVGADRVGTAALKLVVPGESFTLPLGVDSAVRTARNVRLVQSQEGLISKDDVSTYEVTLEVSNPYPFPLKTRVVDQVPLSKQRELEVTLVRAEPVAQRDETTSELRWDLVIPPSSKKTVTFEYTLRRPRDWRLSQSQ
ncbi:TonB-dependent receptor [Myxococcus stipitatus DSM 14675]|uniref:TonB-dependent receptor n=1 Tax=Myxococcus stipitatus (strain DSM 14675 / JCM 12634 / Mx s8) TaxID=1278073 RepID=L7U8J1_MYXSD|nr:mucoidy inhibitor MuiA family protein [Myxococcus stipitatus]AGC43877.1 TonB-dependent receptor [Myxococcus stipitatus DSM 14675]